MTGPGLFIISKCGDRTDANIYSWAGHAINLYDNSLLLICGATEFVVYVLCDADPRLTIILVCGDCIGGRYGYTANIDVG